MNQMNWPMRKEGKVMDKQRIVFITGAAKGIGKAVAEKFQQEGYTVAATDILFKDGQQENNLHTFFMDVKDYASVESVVKKAEASIGEIDTLVNVAGIFESVSVFRTSEELWHEIYEINVNGTFYVTKIVGEKMKHRRRGSMVIVSSNASKFPRIGMAAYASSKAAVSMYTKCLALELAEYGIRCNIVSPGSTNTDMQKKLWNGSKVVPMSVLSGDLSNYRLGIPLNKIAEPSEIADAIYFLASDRAGHITMEELTIDGGATMGV